MDNVNTEIERLGAPSFKKLIGNPAELTEADLVSLSFLFADLFVRNPAHINKWKTAITDADDMMRDVTQRASEGTHEGLLIIGDPSKFSPRLYGEAPSITLDELRKRAAMLRSKGGHRLAADDLFSALADLAACIQQMTFLTLEAPEGLFFLTSDTPLILRRRANGSRIGVGWANPDALGLIALSPNRFVLMFYEKNASVKGIKATPKQVKRLNAELIRMASLEVFAPFEYCEADDWMKGKRLRQD